MCSQRSLVSFTWYALRLVLYVQLQCLWSQYGVHTSLPLQCNCWLLLGCSCVGTHDLNTFPGRRLRHFLFHPFAATNCLCSPLCCMFATDSLPFRKHDVIRARYICVLKYPKNFACFIIQLMYYLQFKIHSL
jgi:hypothetical protein